MSVKTQMTPKGAQPLLQRPAEAATRTTPVQTGPFEMRLRPHDRHAPVAQLDRAPDYESGGQRFESFRARHFQIAETCIGTHRNGSGCTDATRLGAFTRPRVRQAVRGYLVVTSSAKHFEISQTSQAPAKRLAVCETLPGWKSQTLCLRPRPPQCRRPGGVKPEVWPSGTMAAS